MPLRRKAVPYRLGKPLGGKSERANEWLRCLAKGCWHRVPPGAIHALCQRAWSAGPPLPVTHRKGNPCCPGRCGVCLRCLDRCPGLCPTCNKCLDTCNGHDEDDTKG